MNLVMHLSININSNNLFYLKQATINTEVSIVKNNKIPRKFNLLVGRMLIDTNMSKVNDTLHITKNERGFLAFNTRTKQYATLFVSMLRNGEVFELVSVE